MEHRYLPMENMTTREEGDDLYLEGYFAVFNGVYELRPGATESIAPGAFDDSVGDDVRALFNHWFWDGPPPVRWSCGRMPTACGAG